MSPISTRRSLRAKAPLRRFSAHSSYGLFALEGLAFWETPSPSNTNRFVLPLSAAGLFTQEGTTPTKLHFLTTQRLFKNTTWNAVPQTKPDTAKSSGINGL